MLAVASGPGRRPSACVASAALLYCELKSKGRADSHIHRPSRYQVNVFLCCVLCQPYLPSRRVLAAASKNRMMHLWSQVRDVRF